jgi:hypothetical protein
MFANICQNFIQADENLRTDIEFLLKISQNTVRSRKASLVMPYRSEIVYVETGGTDSDEEVYDEFSANNTMSFRDTPKAI